MRISVGVTAAVAVLVLLGPGPGRSAPAGGEYQGSEACSICHEETARDFQKTAHAAAPGWDAERGCEECHGPGEAHIDAGDGSQIGALSKLPARKVSDVCLECHRKDHGRARFRRSLHSLSDVACTDCHDPHSSADKLLPKGGVELCADCHASIVGQFALPRSHPLSNADSGCANCHNPHGTTNARNLRSAGNDTCFECHAEKAGPFVYSHDTSLVDGCRSCHQIHGSPNRHLLTHSRQISLCYECHSGANTPGFHGAENSLHEKCTACHTAIHGSNTNQLFLED